MLLHGFGLAGYRSFPTDAIQKVAPLTRINLIVGQNNAGKSNVLAFIAWLLGGARREPFTHHDYPIGSGEGPVTVFAAISRSDPNWLDIEQRVLANLANEGVLFWQHLLDALCEGDEELLWAHYVARPSGGPALDEDWVERVARSLPSEGASQVNRRVSDTSGGGLFADAERIVRSVAPQISLPPVVSVPAFRQIAGGDEIPGKRDGRGLIEQLAALESPVSSRYLDRDRFEDVEKFVQDVFEDQSISIKVPHDRETINIIRNGSYLPLSSFGTGMHQVVILAVAATLAQESLLLIEEPEVHMHPILQRKLLRYLHDHTSNQYVIATHSAHMLDSDIASIFHVRSTGDGSVIQRASAPGDLAEIAADLGYRASDLVQANAVIWVEGPSDRVYIRHWLGMVAPDLIEGLHYSVMFYGGGLLSHLSVDEDAIDDFIKLQRLNRNCVVVIDSDLSSLGGEINSSKRRVRDEVRQMGGVVWITDGYTIENYVPATLLNAALDIVHPSATEVKNNLRTNPLGKASTGLVKPKKDRIARTVVEHWTEEIEGRGDLNERITEVANYVRGVNGLASSKSEN